MERLRELRLAHGRTQKEMADFLHVDRTTYVKYETSASEPKFAVLKKLSDYFDVSTDYLLGESQNKKEPAVPKDSGLRKSEQRLLELFKMVPEDQQDLVLAMVEAALKNQQ